jgi:hypothetical protein
VDDDGANGNNNAAAHEGHENDIIGDVDACGKKGGGEEECEKKNGCEEQCDKKNDCEDECEKKEACEESKGKPGKEE